ncbi:hypothetical protein FACS1894199_15610 [Bacteroidia bacterium]|nr:hypothetical protein FACS1894199_15610 [Bacteroidia bacterium]
MRILFVITIILVSCALFANCGSKKKIATHGGDDEISGEVVTDSVPSLPAIDTTGIGNEEGEKMAEVGNLWEDESIAEEGLIEKGIVEKAAHTQNQDNEFAAWEDVKGHPHILFVDERKATVSSTPFHLIGGSFKKRSYADKLLKKYIKDGYTDAKLIIEQDRGLYRVSLMSLETVEDAHEIMSGIISSDPDYDDFWILVK